MISTLQRLTLSVGLAAVAVLVPTPAHAASPQPERVSFTEGFTDPNFCGTGEAVSVVLSVKGVEFASPNRADFAGTFRGTETFTYGDTTVTRRFANRFTDTIVAGEEEGVHTHAFTSIGLPEKFSVKGGGVITRDAGRITFLVTYDENDEVVSEEVISSGPHPQADSDFELFCQVVPEALGIES